MSSPDPTKAALRTALAETQQLKAQLEDHQRDIDCPRLHREHLVPRSGLDPQDEKKFLFSCLGLSPSGRWS